MKVDNVERTYSRKLGEFVERLAFDDVPKKVIEEAKLHILDTLGGGSGGLRNGFR